MERRFRIAIGALSAVGIGIAAYLLVARATATPLACPTGGCDVVQRSRYSELLGVPVAALGLVAYVTLAATALGRNELLAAAGAAVGLAAVVFSSYLLLVQLVVIGAVCAWCIAADVVTALVALLAIVRLHPAVRGHVREVTG